MDWEEMRQEARRKLGKVCPVCPVCNGVVCAGQMPGMGGLGTGASFKNNVAALATFRLNMRTLHAVDEPALGVTLLGQALALPVLGAAIAGAQMNLNGALSEEELAYAMLAGSATAGTLAMTGDGPDPEVWRAGLAALARAGGRGIPIIKPRPLPAILERAKQAADAGALAVGIDVDAAGILMMRRAGQPVGPKPLAELRELVARLELPLVLKGVMTVADAETAAAAGAAAIVISNHGGRSLDHLPGTAEVLPEIAAAVNGKLTILVDGGIRAGVDVLKMLALGADAVLLGRPLAIAAVGGGAEGVALALRRLADELRTAMVLTACPSPSAAGPHILRAG